MDIKSRFQSISTDKKKRNIIVAVGLIGIILIFLSDFMLPQSESGEDNTSSAEQQKITESSAESYKAELENELISIISEIEGAGEVKIMITMESTTEDVYAVERSCNEQSQSSEDGSKSSAENMYEEDNTYVTVKNKDGSESVVKLKQLMPKIRGVLVVCDGGGNPVVQEKITQAVSSVLNISSGKVYVTN